MPKKILGDCLTLINSFSIHYKQNSTKNKYPGYKYYLENINHEEPISRSKWLKLYSDYSKIHKR